MFILIVQKSLGQKDIVIGKILDENLSELPGVFIEINSKIIDTTDFRGNFQLKLTPEMKTITTYALGFQSEVINISENCNLIEVIMLESSTHDFVSLKVAERKRIRRRKKVLPDLYLKAYQKKIFTNEKPCW